MRVLLTGMSGVGKSTLVAELRRRGCLARDADDDGFSEPREDGRWGWRRERVAALLATATAERPLYFAGCSEEQAELPFDYRVLLTAPRPVLVERLRTRASDGHGGTEEELAQVLDDLEHVEPLLRRSADLVLSGTVPAAELADALLAAVGAQGASGASVP